MDENMTIKRPIYYTGFEMSEHEFTSSTPLKRKLSGAFSISTQSRSAGYGTLKISEKCNKIEENIPKIMKSYPSVSSYGKILIAPNCSFEISDENAFCDFDLSDPEINDVFDENPKKPNQISARCKICRKKFKNRIKLKIHNDQKHPVTMVTLVVL